MKNLSIYHKIALSIFIVVWIILLLRLWVITVQWHDHYEYIAQQNAFKREILVPSRGIIFDRNNEPLAINKIFFGIFITPMLDDKKLETAIKHIVAHIKDQDTQSLIEVYKKQNSRYNHEPINVVNYLTYEEIQEKYASLIQQEHIIIKPSFRRFYPHNELASHIIGYVGAADKNDIFYDPISKYTAIIGKEGMEKYYNTVLQGHLGYRDSVVNAYNQKVSQTKELKPQIQNNIILTIDSKLQQVIDKEYVDKSGAAIVMDIQTGEILAAGSYPEYNLNDFVGGISVPKWNALRDNIHTPLVNRLVNGQYPPGSVIKMGVLMSILEYGNVNEHTKIETPYSIKVANHEFRDWKAGGHGSADAFKAIRESVDVYFYKMSQVVGIENMTNVLSQMGFGKQTGIDFPSEYVGILPTPTWKIKRYGTQWFVGDTMQTSIGQGSFLVTPMQIVRYTALIASGELPTPHFLKKQNDEEIIFKSKDVLNDFQKSKLSVLRRGMFEVCNVAGGTALRRTQGARVKIACKTGTAQVVSIPQETKKRIKESELEYFKRSHAWLTGYVPANNPKYAITILIEHGQSGGNGGEIMVAITNELDKLGYFKN